MISGCSIVAILPTLDHVRSLFGVIDLMCYAITLLAILRSGVHSDVRLSALMDEIH
jgi:hypothetical protein